MTSGSSRSLIAVKPLRSANSTVMVRRFASVSTLWGVGRDPRTVSTTGFGIGAGWTPIGTVAGIVGDDGFRCLPASTASSTWAPHFGQYVKSGAHTWPQPGHAFGCFAPHFGQNAKPL